MQDASKTKVMMKLEALLPGLKKKRFQYGKMKHQENSMREMLWVVEKSALHSVPAESEKKCCTAHLRRQATDTFIDFHTFMHLQSTRKICTWQRIVESDGECHPIRQRPWDEEQGTSECLATRIGQWEVTINSTSDFLVRYTPSQHLGPCDPILPSNLNTSPARWQRITDWPRLIAHSPRN